MANDIYFTVTVDTEADDAWKVQDHIGMKNMGAIPRFQQLCERFGVVPTYLLTYECAVRDEALKVLKPISDQGRCEIGFHMHCWTTPPFERPSSEGVDLKWRNAYQYELPDSLYQEKAECLLKAIENAFGGRPTAHRAGRWGIDQRSVDWLVKEHFLVDTSVVPLWNLSFNPGRSMAGPNFMTSPSSMFNWLHSSAGPLDPKSIMEVPLTVYKPQNLLALFLAAYLTGSFRGARTAAHLYRKLIGGEPLLRPNPAYGNGVIARIIRSNLDRRPAVINMMVHSSELMLGQSPFSRTAADCEKLWDLMRQAFVLIRQNEIPSMGLSACTVRVQEQVTTYECPDFTPGLGGCRWSGRLLQEATRQILTTGEPADYRSTARGGRLLPKNLPPAS